MKKIVRKAFLALLAVGMFSCSLDEWNPSTVGTDVAYEEKAGFESLINYSYDALYYLYGKVDGIGVMEMGVDLWTATSSDPMATYNTSLNTTHGQVKVLWESLYATINYCNTAIYYADLVEGYASPEELNARIAEAYFLRGWSNWHLVEQYGNVTLKMESSAIVGSNPNPVRNTEVEFYDQIISDLKFAAANLPMTTTERGRATRKAAYAMLAKAYLQRTRLGEANASEWATLALEAAEELIENQAEYGIALYQSDAEQSGFGKLWASANNKNNTEFLFVESIDNVSGLNPDSWNRGRNRQYYVADTRTVGAIWGTQERDYGLSRANTRSYKPTKYLLTEVFEPVEDPADTRFAESFFYEYYNATGVDKTGDQSAWASKVITQEMVQAYQKDPSLVGHTILNTVGTLQGPRGTIYASGQRNMVDNDGDGWLDGLSVFTPNWTMDADEKAIVPFWVVDPSDQFQADGKWVTPENGDEMATFNKEMYPSMKKFSAIELVSSVQEWAGDIPILRLGEVYLNAAEAALRANNDKATALKYVNEIRKRAAVTGRQNEMLAQESDMTLDYILEERARELLAEQVRWCDLKRFGKLTKAYFEETNPDIADNFDPAKHTRRPIPQSQLDATTNPEEYGNNGY